MLKKIDSSSVESLVKDSMDPGSELISDGERIYTKVKEIVKDHKQELVDAKQADMLLPRVHIAISNAKRVLLEPITA
ncbi:MAG: hypothetical protein MK086_10935 [Flavobacteriales bacterium]|nr:hypothetical protein [Flavobacteriales bacterium]